MYKHKLSFIVLALVGCLLLALLVPGAGLDGVHPAQAAIFVVTSSGDGPDGICPDPTNCTLRAALATAKNGDTINFLISLSGPITLAQPTPLTIATNVSIAQLGGAGLAIDGNNAVTVFTVNSGVTASISGLTIQHGNGTGDAIIPNGQIVVNSGGGIVNNGTLTVTNTTLASNVAKNAGGAIVNNGTLTANNSTFSANTALFGGGIYNAPGAQLTINSRFLGNSASFGGGGIANTGTLTVSSTFTGNSASFGGGGIFNTGTLTVSGSTFTGNSASGGNGGGGGIFNIGTLTVSGSTFSANTAANVGGGIANGIGATLTIDVSGFGNNSANVGVT